MYKRWLIKQKVLYYAGRENKFLAKIENKGSYYFTFNDIRSLAGCILPGNILSLGNSAKYRRIEDVSTGGDEFKNALIFHKKSSEIAEAITKVPQQTPTIGGLKKKKPSTKKKTSTKKKPSTKKKTSIKKKKTSTKRK